MNLPKERDMKIYERRNEGATYPEIAKEFNITTQAASDTYKRTKERLEILEEYEIARELSSRTFNMINRAERWFNAPNIRTKEELIQALKKGFRVRSLGEGSRKELEEYTGLIIIRPNFYGIRLYEIQGFDKDEFYLHSKDIEKEIDMLEARIRRLKIMKSEMQRVTEGE